MGCETSRCQTTAWDASVWAVTGVAIDGRHDHTGVGHLRRVPAVPPDHAADGRADPPRACSSAHEIRADVAL